MPAAGSPQPARRAKGQARPQEKLLSGKCMRISGRPRASSWNPGGSPPARLPCLRSGLLLQGLRTRPQRTSRGFGKGGPVSAPDCIPKLFSVSCPLHASF